MQSFECQFGGFTGREESVSIGSSLLSLAERGTMTPARQRTVTEVVWPEHIAAALNSGLRSRLNSSTSLFRAGSQKSVLADGSEGLDRRESQRSIVGETSFRQQPSGQTTAAATAATANYISDAGLTAASSMTSGWRSEQGSPRRPASLVLSDSNTSKDLQPKSAQESPQGSYGGGGGATPTAVLSPPAVKQRFNTTNVDLIPQASSHSLLCLRNIYNIVIYI